MGDSAELASVLLPPRLQVLPPKLAWNIGGGRNLLMHRASGCWVIIADLDYAVPPKLAAAVLPTVLDPAISPTRVFKFMRDWQPKGRPQLHPAFAMMRRDLYWQAGGCDEDFVGHYGWTDPHTWFRLGHHRPRVTITVNRSWPAIHYLRAGANRTSQSKDKEENANLYRRKTSGAANWSNVYLRFKWVEHRHTRTASSRAHAHRPASAGKR